jgi:hypothetical protein
MNTIDMVYEGCPNITEDDLDTQYEYHISAVAPDQVLFDREAPSEFRDEEATERLWKLVKLACMG